MRTDTAAGLKLEGLLHDLNNMFQTISEAADLLEEDPHWLGVAGVLHRSVSRGRRIVDSFSTSAPAPQDFGTTLDNAIEFARDVFQAMHAPQVEFVRAVEAGIYPRGSPGAWERVLLNLFVNAAQAMKQAGVVEITARRQVGAIEISVADNGPGIASEILPRIFEPRFSTKSSGSGLGLHIVKSIVTENGGSITAANRIGAPGVSFCIRTPET